MKVRNKKTGEVVILIDHIFDNYKNLAELNEEWEDYKEPKKHYFTIDGDGVLVCRTSGDFLNEGLCKEIGNYFETREEAEQAVEKLKAWKRLKDSGISFEAKVIDGRWYLGPKVEPKPRTSNEVDDLFKDIMFIFGGEE